jgi:hypothetical protein
MCFFLGHVQYNIKLDVTDNCVNESNVNKNGNIDRQKFPLINSIVREEESASLNVVFSRIYNATHN